MSPQFFRLRRAISYKIGQRGVGPWGGGRKNATLNGIQNVVHSVTVATSKICGCFPIHEVLPRSEMELRLPFYKFVKRKLYPPLL